MDWHTLLIEHWPTKVVCLLLIWAAWIDGKQLRVPNWLTFPMVLSGLIYNSWANGWEGLSFGGYGMVVGLLTLMPLYAVGGMGAGDVKLMAGMGAWLGPQVTWDAFCVSVVVGALMAVVMVWKTGKFNHHYGNFLMIWNEWTTIRNPRKLSEIAAERKPRMHLLPYGIPICIGSIAYFIYAGLV